MVFSFLSDWIATLSLIFGGCCSNAITLEQLTSEYPHAGSLLTFFQFLIISLYGLPKHVTWTHYGPRFTPRRIPLTPYLIQVALFYFISLLNNAAFAYRIPMAVHIIFRSGGLIISMLFGWLVIGKRYTPTQIVSVLLVTLGVALATLSASGSATRLHTNTAVNKTNTYTYATGIAILTLALLLSGFLGLVQDRTYAKYGRPPPPGGSNGFAKSHSALEQRKGSPSNLEADKSSLYKGPAWQESMFYLHFLALPMFISLRTDLAAQFHVINAGTRFSFHIPLPVPLLPPFLLPGTSSFISVSPTQMSIHIPKAYLPLLMNTLTQLLCVAGVHRLTTRVSALSVTLVLVVRKAASLVLSVVGISVLEVRSGMGPGKGAQEVDLRMVWAGAVMVLLGTIGYTIATGARGDEKGKDKRE